MAAGYYRSYSPLRYPGGKSVLVPTVRKILANCNEKFEVFAEPFAGGAGVSIDLLLNGMVKRIVLNDIDSDLTDFWKTVIHDPEYLIAEITNASLNIEEYQKQKNILNDRNADRNNRAFAYLYLNRTNRSGIIKAGPIGGKNQDGKYNIYDRFNRKALIEKIRAISLCRDRIRICNMDALEFMKNSYHPGTLFFIDPPYFRHGNQLYRFYFDYAQHYSLAEYLEQNRRKNWILTYDDCEEIRDMYSSFDCGKITLNHSAANKGKQSELLILSDSMKFAAEFNDPVQLSIFD